jgi:hypothetical protein
MINTVDELTRREVKLVFGNDFSILFLSSIGLSLPFSQRKFA